MHYSIVVHMTRYAKIKREEFNNILNELLLTQKEFANSIKSSQPWISKLASSDIKYKCQKNFIKSAEKTYHFILLSILNVLIHWQNFSGRCEKIRNQ